jgi:putative FmdB family regulatory protein
MPIYAYRCCECGEEFEKLVMSAAKADEVVCPICQAKEVERRPTLFGLGGSAGAASGAADRSCAPAIGGG